MPQLGAPTRLMRLVALRHRGISAGRGGRRVSAARHVNPRGRKRRGCDRVLPVRCHLVLPRSLNNSHLCFSSDSERYPSTLASLRYRTEKKIKVRRRGGPGANLWEKPVSVLTYLFFQAKQCLTPTGSKNTGCDLKRGVGETRTCGSGRKV